MIQPHPPAAVPAAAPTVEFRAKWEVDAFDVPATVADLFFEGALFQQVAHQLSDAVATGLKRLLVTSVHDGEGRTSVAIGMAIAAAASGLRVALVDADVSAPTLIDDLRLDVEFGWVEALRGRLPLEEICIHAIEDNVTLVPLLPPTGANAATDREVGELISRLEPGFDLIVVDGGASVCETTYGSLGYYDSAMIVCDRTRTSNGALGKYSQQLHDQDVLGIGVIENFSAS